MSKKHLISAKKLAIKHKADEHKLTIEFLLAYSLYEEGNKQSASNEVYRIASLFEKLGKIDEKMILSKIGTTF